MSNSKTSKTLRTYKIFGSCSVSELKSYEFTGTLRQVQLRAIKSCKFLISEFNSFKGSVYILDVELDEIVGGYEFNDFCGYHKRSPKRINEEDIREMNYIYAREQLTIRS